MKLELSRIRITEQVLSRLIDKEIPIKIGWKLSKIKTEISRELNLIEEQRIKLIQKHGIKDEKTGNYTVPKENTTSFFEEFNDFLKEEVEVKYDPIDINSLGDISLSTRDLEVLSLVKIIDCKE